LSHYEICQKAGPPTTPGILEYHFKFQFFETKGELKPTYKVKF
jgi:hypothetical protein